MKVAVASGKGGTGKTTVAVNLANLIKEDYQVYLLDCDVEEPNAHLFLKPSFEKSYPQTVPVPQVNQDNCDYCGRCSEVCAFNALAILKKKILFYEHMCHSCGSCIYFCPREAMVEVPREIGLMEVGFYRVMGFVHGILNIGEAMAPPLIKEVKKYQDRAQVTVIDVPPGTSCPVVASLKNIDFCLIVTEATPFGLNDMDLLVQLLKEMKVPYGVVLNRADLGDDGVEKFCEREKIPLFLKLPFDREIARLNAEGVSLIEEIPWVREAFKDLWSGMKELMKFHG